MSRPLFENGRTPPTRPGTQANWGGAVFLVDNLAALEKNDDLGLVPGFQKSQDMLDLKIEIMPVGVGPEFDFFEMYDFLVLLGLVRTLALLVHGCCRGSGCCLR